MSAQPSKTAVMALGRHAVAARYLATYFRSGDATQRAVALRNACIAALANGAEISAEDRAEIAGVLADLEADRADR